MVGGSLSRASVLRVGLGVSRSTIVSGSYSRPLHSWISLLLTSSLSLGISSLFVVQPSACESCRSLNSRLCVWSWLTGHPAKIEITRSSGGSSHHTKSFFFYKNHDISRFLINFSTVVVVKHTDVVDPKRLIHIHSHRDLNSLSLSTESTHLLVPMS
jgi:hypothetical protein